MSSRTKNMKRNEVITQFYNEFLFHELWLISNLNNVTNFSKSFTHIFLLVYWRYRIPHIQEKCNRLFFWILAEWVDSTISIYCWFKHVDLNTENQWRLIEQFHHQHPCCHCFNSNTHTCFLMLTMRWKKTSYTYGQSQS